MKYTIAQLETIINTNTSVFIPGKAISSAVICKLAGLTNRRKFTSFADEQSHNLKKMKFYVSLNKVLALRGIYVKSSNYYSKFEVLPMSKVPARVTAYGQTSVAKLRRASALKAGLPHNGNWSPLTPTERASLT